MERMNANKPAKSESLKDRLAYAVFGGIIDRKVAERLPAAAISASEDIGWRRLTGDAERELLSITQERMIEIAYWLWETNPLGGWLIEIMVAFVLGDGLPYEAKDPEVKKILDDFWNNPVNRMDIHFEKHVRELGIFGELMFPAYTAQQTGRLYLGYIDPANIDQVFTDPENVKMKIGVSIKGKNGAQGKRYGLILPDEAEYVLSDAARLLRQNFTDGECFFYAINNVTNSPRGRSDLIRVADWLDAYEQFLFDYAEKWPLLNAFLWDLVVEGGDDAKIEENLKKITKKSGSVFAHNEKTKLNAVTPDLKAVDAAEGARLLRNHILSAKNMPEHWFGGGGDVNRATAAEMGTPVFKALSMRQKMVKYILEDLFSAAIRKARQSRYSRITDEQAKQYSVITPEITSKDVSKFAAAIQQIAGALVTAETNGWIDRDTAQNVFGTAMGFIGVDIDLETVKKTLKEKPPKGFEDYEPRV
mgnify:CR=1 FL=1